MVARPFWKWLDWKSIGFYPHTQVLCYWSLELIFKAKLKLQSGNQKIQYGHQAAILKVTLQKIFRFLPMATTNRHMKFEIEIPKQTRLALRKPWHLQTDRQGESSIPPSNYFRWEHKNNRDLNQGVWNIWSKFGDCCLKGRWVRVRTSSGMMHGHTQIDTCNNNIRRPRKTRATLNAEIPLAA